MWFTGRIGIVRGLFFKSYNGEIINLAERLTWSQPQVTVNDYQPVSSVKISY